MPIPVRCECGQRFKLRDDRAGTRIKCPGCAAVIDVPDPSRPDPDSLPVLCWGLPADWVQNVVVLTARAVILGHVDPHSIKRTVVAIQAGEPPAAVLGADQLAVPLDDIAALDIDLNTHRMTAYVVVRFQQGQTRWHRTLYVRTSADRDEMAHAIRNYCGGKWTERRWQVGRWLAVPLSVVVFAACVALLWLFVHTAGQLEPDAAGVRPDRNSFLKTVAGWFLDKFGFWFTAVCGGLVNLAALAWVANQFVNPPLLLTLERVRK